MARKSINARLPLIIKKNTRSFYLKRLNVTMLNIGALVGVWWWLGIFLGNIHIITLNIILYLFTHKF